MISPRLLPLLVSLVLTSLLIGDAVSNERGMDVLLIPSVVVLAMIAASLMILLFRPTCLSNNHSVSPIEFSHQGHLIWLCMAAFVVVIVPRIGIPVLAFSIARYHNATLKTAFLSGVGAAVMIEVVFLVVLGLSFPPVTLW